MGHTPFVLPALARGAVDDLLARLDRAVPGRIEGFYVVGSASMGAFRPGRSDVDFVAIVSSDFRSNDLLRLRALHSGRWTSALIRDAVLRRRWPLVCNGIYLKAGDVSLSPLEVTPLAGHVAGRFGAGRREGFDVNPVTWHVLARNAIAVRGPDRDQLQIRVDDAELRAWALANLNGYWRCWAARVRQGGMSTRGPPRRLIASGVLGAPRLHYTIATGGVATKEAAAEYAREVFEPRWHALIDDAASYWRGGRPSEWYRRQPHRRRRGDAAEFVVSVIDAANRLTIR